MKIFWSSCSRCDFGQLERVPRTFWMRLLPRWRHYHCAQCSANVLAPKKIVESRRWATTTLKSIRITPLTGQNAE